MIIITLNTKRKLFKLMYKKPYNDTYSNKKILLNLIEVRAPNILQFSSNVL